MFKKAGIVFAVLIVVLIGLAMTKPDNFSVHRSISINASPEKIFPLINDLHSWSSWSPWENIDPAMKKSFSGSTIGIGSVYDWDGNSKVGQGRMEITQSIPSSKVIIKLDFLKPVEGHDTAEFTLEPNGNSTTVTWSMSGPSRFITKVMQVFISMDSMLGKQFETGLGNLKTISEK